MIDLSRPPVRPGPRFSGWVILALVWVVSFAVLVVVYSLADQPPATQGGVPTPGAAEFLLVIATIGLVAGLVFMYASMRLRAGGSVWSNALLAQGYPVGDPDMERRLSDPEERAAWRRFKRGEITRIAYERVMARCRFVHGEVSATGYHEILRNLTLASEETPPRTVGLERDRKGR